MSYDIEKAIRKAANAKEAEREEMRVALAAVRRELAQDKTAGLRSDDYGRLHALITEALGKFATEGGA